jgi:hypothetical protein
MKPFNFTQQSLSRRLFLERTANGFGALALTSLLNQNVQAETSPGEPHTMLPRVPHHPAKAKHVIFLYMDGGPSQMDTFDPKPLLDKEHGQPIKMKVQRTQFDNVGKVLKSPWEFKQHGESGIWVSSLFPHVAQCADDLCIIRSMTSEFSEHTNANYFLHTGHGLQGRPSMGAWVAYGLGTVSQNLPGFVVLNGGLTPPGGLDCFHNGFLPATFQGSVFLPGEHPVADLTSERKLSPQEQKLEERKWQLLNQLDQGTLARLGRPDEIDSAIKNFELASRMQLAVPDLMDVSAESKSTQELYGFNATYPLTRTYAHQCLVARRLIERGVRFVEITCPNVKGDRWDQHGNLKEGHELNSLAVDQPIAGLLTDLKQRGLLEDTLIIWGGEFGRTPMAQGENGRDHNPFGFTMWLAGGGVKPGLTYGATDEYGYHAIENKMEIHDLHATMLHLLGVDHTRLTVRNSSRDMRLTDVFGHVFHDIIA